MVHLPRLRDMHASRACRKAVMVGDPLDNKQMKTILLGEARLFFCVGGMYFCVVGFGKLHFLWAGVCLPVVGQLCEPHGRSILP